MSSDPRHRAFFCCESTPQIHNQFVITEYAHGGAQLIALAKVFLEAIENQRELRIAVSTYVYITYGFEYICHAAILPTLVLTKSAGHLNTGLPRNTPTARSIAGSCRCIGEDPGILRPLRS